MKDVVDRDKEDFETFLSDDDFNNAHAAEDRVDFLKLGIKVKDDPTMSKYMEGDIAMDDPKKFVEENNQLGRNAIKQQYRRWPSAEIPYTLSNQYGNYARSVIAKAMKEYHDKTCVRFVPRDERRHQDYIYIHPDDGCYSLVGKTGGRQPVSLDSGCIQLGTIVHELMHAVGFFHEQSRQDRDTYIEIVWRNVMNGADDQFEKYNLNVIDHLNEPYDYASIMHYGPYAFSGSGKKTIIPRKGGAEKMGQRIAFSDGDLRKINRLYTCNAPKSNVVNNQHRPQPMPQNNQNHVQNRPPNNQMRPQVPQQPFVANGRWGFRPMVFGK
ncbi:hypothetical protein WR25_13368 [Diploscapter pachys]|uniref:Metalloendopeptidase n=1 Tax=Diploscapter pachys TaxID=2018661 RepID=A0A2A2J267_9BILA|nr:hypothetical protein WR25_13368 [Diploscapter pachys]